MFSHQKAHRLVAWVFFYMMFLTGTALVTHAQSNVPYPNTTIRAATEEEKIRFRWHDLCRERGLPLYNLKCIELSEQAKRDVLGSRYKRSNAGNGARAVLWGFDAIGALGGQRNGSLPPSGRAPYGQYPPRRFAPSTPPFAGNSGSYGNIFSQRMPTRGSYSRYRNRRYERDESAYPRYEREGYDRRGSRRSGGWRSAAQDILGSVLSRQR